MCELRGGVVPIEQRIELRDLRQRCDVSTWRRDVRERLSGRLLSDLRRSDHVHELCGGYFRLDGGCNERVELRGVRVGYFIECGLGVVRRGMSRGLLHRFRRVHDMLKLHGGHVSGEREQRRMHELCGWDIRIGLWIQ